MTEQQPYVVVKKYPGFEVRNYPTHLVAEVALDSSFTDAGNRAFAVAMTFSGRWTEQLYQEHLAELSSDVVKAGLEVSGPPRFARFDPPWRPWFLRRNEVVLPILSVV